jgi:hypothetical protein
MLNMSNNLKEKEYEKIKKDEELKDKELLGEKILKQEHKDFELEEQLNPLKNL